jgi:O-antigen biosynthesis protein
MLASGLSVRDTLRLRGSHAVAWAVFDPDWYCATYPMVQQKIGRPDPAAILRFYIESGQGLGHSPNIYFDETWHRRRYPRVADAVARGRVASAFDAYCRVGFHGRSPHWLFDELFYRRRHTDLTEDYLAAQGACSARPTAESG